MRRRAADAIPLASIALAAVAFVRFDLWRSAVLERGVPSPDVYGAQYPMLVQASRALSRGHGPLWSSLANAGQPFLPSTLTAPLYPLNVLFLPFGLLRGYAIIACVHLAIGAAGVYLLCREYGAGRAAALCGAFAFLLSSSTVTLASWMPTVILGGYVWIPVALLLLERTLADPGPRRAIGLASVLALQLLAGFPQLSLFTYQLIALRLVWQLATVAGSRCAGTLGWVGVGLVLPVFLAAVYLVPGLEFMRQSIRRGPLALHEMRLGTQPSWARFLNVLNGRLVGPRPFAALPIALAVAVLGRRERRSITAFWAVVGLLYLVLIFDNPVFRLYLHLPFATMFRDAERFLWVVFLALSILAGLGADVCLASEGTRRASVTAMLAIPAGALAYAWLTLFAANPNPYLFLAATLALLLVGARWTLGLRVASTLVPLLVLWNLYQGVGFLLLRYMASDAAFHGRAGAYDFLRAHMTPQDRFLTFGGTLDLTMQLKVSSMVDLPTPIDYEPQTSYRLAAYWVMLRSGQVMSTINQYLLGVNRPTVARRPLLDLLATRYVMFDPAIATMEAVFDRPLRFLEERDGVRIYENPDALPRAYFVPRLEVVPDPVRLLSTLAAATADPRRAALVEAPPADGFLGTADAGQGTVALRDRSEDVVLDVDADAPGFVVLTDQYYPGWSAMVNGVPADILRANYAFRAVRVPAGRSTVHMTYRPRSLLLGGLVSLVSGASLLAWAVVASRAALAR